MLFLKDKGRKKALVIGLDGVPIGLLKALAESGVMPKMAEIIAEGGLRQMRASLPPISSVSWTSFMTGANPAEHGIFGFTDVDPDTYALKFPFFSDVKIPTFWDKLGKRGFKCAVLNQPATYPARDFPGVLVSGFVALDLEKSIWPRKYLAALKQIGYLIDVDSQKAKDDLDGLLDDLDATLKTRRMATAYFAEEADWDYFQVVVTGTDRLQHFLWNAVVEESDPRHDRALSYYAKVDDFIGKLWERFHQGRTGDNEGDGVALLSDHGFCGQKKDIRLNAWLATEGYLKYASEEPRNVSEIAAGTRAFALDPGRIYLNVKGRFGKGCVEPGEAEGLRGEIAGKLAALEYEGEKVIPHIFTREQAFEGPLVDSAPDLVLVSKSGFDLKGTTRGKEVFADTHFQGMHTWGDAFVWSKMAVPEDPEIADLAGVISGWLTGEG